MTLDIKWKTKHTKLSVMLIVVKIGECWKLIIIYVKLWYLGLVSDRAV
jgi:hypothetical protein